MNLVSLTKNEWNDFSSDAHLVCFNESDRVLIENIDFALIVEDENKIPLAYGTFREIDKETIYMKHGGAFPSAKGTSLSYKSYCLIVDTLLNNYKNILTNIENTNTPMLKFAMKFGFKIVGIKNIDNKIYLEHYFRR